MARRLLLVSTSTTWGTGYLDHCAGELAALYAGVRTLLFVPFALADRDGYAAKARERFARLDLRLDSLHEAADPRAAIASAEAFFVGGGNTFRLLDALARPGLRYKSCRSRALGVGPGVSRPAVLPP